MELFESLEELTRLGPEFALKFLVAALCGGAIGMERETTGKPAGLRTSILVCVGSMLFTEVSILMAKDAGGDPTRIAAQIVTGIGFLGAGVILHGKRGGVVGVTTSAMIWVMAALGMMIGAGYLISSILISAASVIMLLTLRRLEVHVHNRQGVDYSFLINDDDEQRERFLTILSFYPDNVENTTIAPTGDGDIQISFRFAGPMNDRRELLHSLLAIKGLRRADKEER